MSKMQPILVTVIALSLFIFCNSARILVVVPTPSISHQVVFRPLTQELARRGHEVVVITTDPAFPKGEAPANLTEIDVHDSYEIWRSEFLKSATGKKEDLENQVSILFELLVTIFDKQLKHEEFKKLVQEKQHFDLLIIESWCRPAMVLIHLFKAPVILMSSFGRAFKNYEHFGAPVHLFLYPSNFRRRVYDLTMWEKISELITEVVFTKLYSDMEKKYNLWIKKTFGPDMPSLEELDNKVDMLFVNTHPIWEGINPVPPSIVHIWGILAQAPAKELPQDLKLFIDSSKNGVIYMSFGTNTDPTSLPETKIQMFFRVFSKLPYDILWKWNGDKLPGISKNIKYSKWFPQVDILRHANTKLFITQGGIQSTDEAILQGVPLLGIPMLGDQWYNTEKYVHHNIGLQLEFTTLNEENLQIAIEKIIGNERNNVKKLGKLMNDQPQPALERAVWWTEYVLRHGGARHLRAPAANVSWAQYLELDLIAVVFLVLFIVISITFVLLHCLYRYIIKTFSFTPKIKIK